MKEDKQKRQFSKSLLIQESALIWVVTISAIVLAFVCLFIGAMSELPWITALIAFPWGAYGISQAKYYNKSKGENTQGGIVYETTLAQLNKELENECCDNDCCED